MIPPELVDIVIDHLHDDRQALLACSLVCRAWLPSCRFHKFGSVVIPWPETKGHDFEECPIAAQFVRELTIGSSSLGSWPLPVSLLDSTMGMKLPLCPNVKTLKLWSFNFRHYTPSSLASRFPLPSLKSLFLHRCNFAEQPDLTVFLSGFQNLVSFSSRFTLYGFIHPIEDVEDRSRARIFDTSSYIPRELNLEYLCLDLSLPEPPNFDHINALLEQCGGALKHLIIETIHVRANNRKQPPPLLAPSSQPLNVER